MIRPKALSQIARRVESLDRARAFLRDRLDLVEIYVFPGLAFFDLGATRLMLRETGRREDADLLYLAVDDIEVAYIDLKAKGVTFLQGPQMVHRHSDGSEEWMVFFEDDEGRPLALQAVRSVSPSLVT